MIAFQPLTRADEGVIAHWLTQPHVLEWWHTNHTTPAEELQMAMDAVDEDGVWPYFILHDGVPIGYIQAVDPFAWDGGFYFADQPAGSRGVDLFIGEPGLIGQGLGSQIIDAFAARLFAEGAPKLLIDPDPDNHRAVKAYTKAGFTPYGEHNSAEYGHVLLMSRTA